MPDAPGRTNSRQIIHEIFKFESIEFTFLLRKKKRAPLRSPKLTTGKSLVFNQAFRGLPTLPPDFFPKAFVVRFGEVCFVLTYRFFGFPPFSATAGRATGPRRRPKLVPLAARFIV